MKESIKVTIIIEGNSIKIIREEILDGREVTDVVEIPLYKGE